MSKVLYLECASGISGDMTVGALIDLGVDKKCLMDALRTLPLSGYSIEIKDVLKSGLRACDFNVVLEEDNHDHDMEYLHGHASDEHDHTHKDHAHSAASEHVHTHSHEHTHETTHSHTHEHSHETTHSHSHEHSHEHAHGTHAHHHDARNLSDITQIIQNSQLTENAKTLALKIFHILAEAEAYVHGKSIDEVHFHEVGAVDSIVDIAAVAFCVDALSPDEVLVSALTDGTGQIRCQHGIIPVPVPAVTAISMNHGLVLRSTSIQGELVTPTGAAIAAAFAPSAKLPDTYQIRKMGFGAGKRDYPTTGILRAMILETNDQELSDTVLCLETNVDDCTGETLSYTMQALFDAGALDVFYTPVYMKKNRPATLLKVLCNPKQRTEMEGIIFRNTTTIGIRSQMMQRTKLPRQQMEIETPWGMAQIKCCSFGDEVSYYPENDSVCVLAKQSGIGFTKMYHMLQELAAKHNS